MRSRSVDDLRRDRHLIVAPRSRIVYSPIHKAGCTTVRWVLARAEGDPDRRAAASRRSAPSREQTIHDPDVARLPKLVQLSRAQRQFVLGSSDWTRIAITRDPYARLFSAWRGVLLETATPRWSAHRPALDDVVSPDGSLDVGASFRRFVRRLDREWEVARADPHLRPQTDMLFLDTVTWTELVDLAELDALIDRLHAVAPRVRRPAAPANRSVSLSWRCYDDETAQVVARRYADDFAALGYDADPDRCLGAGERLGPHAVHLLGEVRAARERLHDLSGARGVSPTRWARRRLDAVLARRAVGATGRRGHPSNV
jgi:hypothetical protein